MMAVTGGGSPTPPPTPIVPEGYTQVEYVTLNGSGYLDTGLYSIPENQAALFADFKLSAVTAQMRIITGQAQNYTPQFYVNGSSGLGYRLRGSWAGLSGFTFDTNRHEVEVDYYNKTVRVDNTSATMGSNPNTTSNTGHLLIGGKYSSQPQFKGSIYAAWIKRSGVYVRDYIMCRDSNNVPYAYDKISETLTSFSGSGTTVGPDVTISQ